ncbi:hypothetical protein CDAR_27301 [Caerostris darwini]|uniref:Uncharacterized protein n=1 Tax=Caerostris darwini TaxID=1538125 RepID=A0AAV4RCW9_9ARAC|nr:hypothetical protein CDAR_27301 [Caerostris darwini]
MDQFRKTTALGEDTKEFPGVRDNGQRGLITPISDIHCAAWRHARVGGKISFLLGLEERQVLCVAPECPLHDKNQKNKEYEKGPSRREESKPKITVIKSCCEK